MRRAVAVRRSIDLSLSVGCAPSATTTLRFDTSAYTAGTHRLSVTVTDGAGNVSASEHPLEIAATPPQATPVPTAIPAPAPPPAVTPARRVPTVRELVAVPRRATVSRRGTVALSVLCPRDAPRACSHGLTLAHQGRELGTGRGTSAPGRRVRVTVRLTRSAHSTLKRRRSLAATLIVEGARRPAAIHLRT